MRSKQTSYQVGLYSEFLARWFLRFHGYRILKSRYITGKNTNRAEIDIIAKRKNTVVFIEVKSRKTIPAAWEAITPTQAGRLRRAAETFLVNHHWSGDARFDVIIIHGRHLEWIKGAF